MDVVTWDSVIPYLNLLISWSIAMHLVSLGHGGPYPEKCSNEPCMLPSVSREIRVEANQLVSHESCWDLGTARAA